MDDVPEAVSQVTRRKGRWFIVSLLLVLAGGFIWTIAPTSIVTEAAADQSSAGICAMDADCSSGEFCRLGVCAPWKPEGQCETDQECSLIRADHRFSCCFAGECEDIDQSTSEWIAVNTLWYERGRAAFCPASGACGAPPSCTISSINEAFKASCIENVCVKVPSPDTEDSANEL